jgi:hypothetical protein
MSSPDKSASVKKVRLAAEKLLPPQEMSSVRVYESENRGRRVSGRRKSD